MIRDFDKKCRGCDKHMKFDGVAKTITGRYDRSPYERAWWICNDEDCEEYMMGQAFYVGEHKHGERWNE
jgi:hypothetical protein